MHNAVLVAHLLTELKARSLQFSLASDAFRTGYAALSCLDQSSIDTLKSDRSCVSPTKQAGGKAELVAIIIALVSHLGMNVIAKGVVTAAN